MKFLIIVCACLAFVPQVCAMDLAGLEGQLQGASFSVAEQTLKPYVQDARQYWLGYKQEIKGGQHDPQNMLAQLEELHESVGALARLSARTKCMGLALSCYNIERHLLMAILERAQETGEDLPDGTA